jgi:NitT/TauT family transport system substrate-binding protein
LVICAVLAISAEATRGEAQTRKVRAAIPGTMIAVLAYLGAKLNGYYADEGLDAELIAMRAPTANLAVLAGNVEFSAVPLSALTTALRGAPLKVLSVNFEKPQHVLLARLERQNPRALRGKKIAVVGPGAIDDILLRDVLSANGIDPSREVSILSIGSAETRMAALVSGSVEAAVLIAPMTFKAKEAGFRELVVFAEQNFVLPSGGIVARDEILKTDPATVEKFVRATVMGFLATRDSRANAIKVMAKSMRVEDSVAAKIYDSARPTMTADGGLSDDAQKKMIAFVAKLAEVKETPAQEKFFDFTYIRKAHAALKSIGWKPAS